MRTARTIARTRRSSRTLESTRPTTRPSSRSAHRTSLENRFPTLGNSRACAHLRWRRRRSRSLRRWRAVHRTRSGLRHDHAAPRRLLAQRHARHGTVRRDRRRCLGSFFFLLFCLRRSCFCGRRGWRNGLLHFGSNWCRRNRGLCALLDLFGRRSRGFDHCGRRSDNRRCRWNRRLNHRPRSGNALWRDKARLRRLGRRNFRGRTREHGRLGRRRRNSRRLRRFMRSRSRRLHRGARRWWGRRWRCRLLRDGLQHVAGLRNLREIDLRLEFVFVRSGAPARRFFGSVLVDILPHQHRFMVFNRAGVCLLLGHANLRQRIEDRLALHFQLSC